MQSSRFKRWLRQTVAVISTAACALAQAQTITYYHNDVSGSPIVATDASGNVLWKENYRPYGEKVNHQSNNLPNGSLNKIGFHGKPFDDNTGLSYMQARYYDPVLGRFTGIDPVGVDEDNLHSFNRYAFGNNNPYKYVDPDGRTPVHATLFIVGMTVDALVQYGMNGSVNITDAAIAGVAAAATGGVAAVLARGVVAGTVSAGAAVAGTAVAGGVAGAVSSAAQDLQKGNKVSAANAGINAVAGAVGAGVGARAATSTAGKVNNLIGSKDNLTNHIGTTTRSSNVGPAAKAGAGEIAAGAAVDASTNAIAKKIERPPERN